MLNLILQFLLSVFRTRQALILENAALRHQIDVLQRNTVVRWHRQGFRFYWRWKSRYRWPVRPRMSREIRELIRQMSQANPLLGAPRIHGELLGALTYMIGEAEFPELSAG